MTKKENNKIPFGAYRLYVLIPSRIIDIKGESYKDNLALFKHPTEVIKQIVTFQTIPSQIVIAEKSTHNKHLYLPIFEEDKSDENNSITGEGNYYNQVLLEKKGLFKHQEKAQFTGLFPNDIIPLLDLPDFYFIKNLGTINPIKRLKYFKRKGKLKPKFHQELPKIQYTIEELEELKKEITKIISFETSPKTIQKRYVVTKQPQKLYFSNTAFVPSRNDYAGIEENINKKHPKILKKSLL